MTVLKQIYGPEGALNLLTVGETRWNTAQATLASQLRVRKGLEEFVRYNSNKPDFPKCLMIWRPSTRRDPNTFFVRMEEAELAIRPFCEALS